MTKSLYAEFHVLPGNEARVRELVAELTGKVRSEPGNIMFEPRTLESDARHYFVFEVYTDDQAFDTHVAQVHGAYFNAQLAPLVSGGASSLTWLMPVGVSA